MDSFDLDSADVLATKIEFDDQSGLVTLTPLNGTIQADPLLWIRVFLKWAMQNRASTVQFIRDTNDGIVRQLIHYEAAKDERKWFEALPVDLDWADKAFSDVVQKIGLTKEGKEVTILLIYERNSREISCALPTSDDLVIYLTQARPRILKLSEPFPRD